MMNTPSASTLAPPAQVAARQSVTVKSSKRGSPDLHNQSVASIKRESTNRINTTPKPDNQVIYSQYSGISNERDIEMDNLKTIIIALNQKVKAKDDLES